MSPEYRSSFAETFYKRLWHRGFKGRFAAFQWDAGYSSSGQWVPLVGDAIESYLADYNGSEHTAWQSAAGLKTFANNLRPGTKKHLAAHSMGNIVAGEAIRLGMNVNNYALMQSAVPSACYDDNEARVRQTLQQTHTRYGKSFTMWDNVTPDGDSDTYTRECAYRGRFVHPNLQNVNMVSFFLPPDYATYVPWEINNDQSKPENGGFAAEFHYYPNNQNGQKLYKFHTEITGDSRGIVAREALDHYITDPYEAMPFACHTWGKAQGAQSTAMGVIRSNIDLRDPAYHISGQSLPGFGDQHSGQFNATIQDLTAFYNHILKNFDIDFYK